MDEQELKQLAAQLRKPTGEAGIKTGEWMNKGNLQIYLDTLRVLEPADHDIILEIGMGNGYFVKDILRAHEHASYTGCDFSDAMVAEATKINEAWIAKGQASFVCADVSSMPFANRTFNKVFTVNTIYFWEDRPGGLAEIARVLQPGGSLIIAFRPKHHMEKYPFTRYGFNMFSKDEVSRLLTDNGFTVSDVFENREPDFEMDGQKVPVENVIIAALRSGA